MAPADGPVELALLSSDVPAAVELARAAILAAFTRSGPAADAEPRIASVTEKIRAGEPIDGGLCRVRGSAVGIALWDQGHPKGIIVQILYLPPDAGRPGTYEAFLRAISENAGPVVFSPGGLVGLSDAEENAMMRARGFERFSRSEMRRPPAVPLPPLQTPKGVRIRPVSIQDEAEVARLHLAAFDGTFDQYMYLADPDPAVDAGRAVHEMMSGHYGEFLGWASSLAETEGRAVGASLVVRAPYGPLLISVMVDRAAQGAGVGRALVLANLHELRARGETVVALNVTEGNARAVGLYERLGFVRSLGPEHAWYSRAAVPVAPGEVLRAGSSPVPPDTKASSANRTPRT